METKVGNQQIEQEVLKILADAKISVSTSFLAKKLNMGWGTARAVLLDMVIKGKVKMISTNITPLFYIDKERK